jgi:D-alanine-D-alanine ligase
MKRFNKETVAVLFGGRSVEHEVSVITGHQVMDALKVAGYQLLPIYITKEGEWYAGSQLHNIKQFSSASFDVRGLPEVFRVSLSPDRSVKQLLPHPEQSKGFFKKPPRLWADVYFPTIHGTLGEDGTIQGLFEMADVPYVGSGVLSSAVGMDKVRAKVLFRDAGIPVLDCVSVMRQEWENDSAAFIKRAEEAFKYPMMVKPVSLGSSIGVSRCQNEGELREALEVALIMDENALVEAALVDFIEVNCSVLGPPIQASVCEQPTPNEKLLTFDEKYKRGAKSAKSGGTKGGMASLERIVPAPIPSELTLQIQELSKKAFQLIGASGVVRVDFLLERDNSNLYLNEINTMPGSVAFYLWEATGISFDDLVDKMVKLGLERHRIRGATQFSFEANLLRK